MKNNLHIQALISQLKASENIDSQLINEENLAKELSTENQLSLPLKIISILGGFFASLTFVGFLALSNIIESEVALIFLGSLMIIAATVGGLFIKKLLYDITSISIYITGIILFVIGLSMLDFDYTIICWIVIAVSSIILTINQSYTYSFISLSSIISGFFTLIMFSENYIFLQIFQAILIVLLTYTFLFENELLVINKRINKLYNSFKIIIILAVIAGFYLLNMNNNATNYWMLSIINIGAILYTLNQIFDVLKVHLPNQKLLYNTLVLILLLPTILSPAISGAFLIILLCFYVNYKTGFALSIISLIGFISYYYYNLEITLFTKSIILMISGTLFIAIYLFIYKKISNHEEI